MSLAVGTRFGPFEIVAPLGAGGMGEVYRARDTRLNRDVALKVLPDAFTLDGDRLARFRREAQVLASLSHPNIAAIFGFEDAHGVQALVLELVEGPTLADRVAQGPIPLADAIPIARQIAEALEAAHEQGTVHRDLKPANIKLRPDGAVKVLDFGLAKAIDPAAPADVSATISPTITTPAMTRMGVILGTAAYMSPEQAKGQTVDRRSDVWAFGCVLYEMLTGKRPFEGEDVSDTLAAVLRADPDWTPIPADVPAMIRALIQGCLRKGRRERIGDISTALFLFSQPIADPVAIVARRERRGSLALPLVATAIAFALIGMAVSWGYRRPSPGSVGRFSIVLPEGQRLPGQENAVAISRDGTRFAYVATLGVDQPRATTGTVFVRSISDAEARPIGPIVAAGAFGSPAFSPDGQWIAIWSAEERALKKIPVSGGSAFTICPTPTRPASTAWDGDAILFVQPEKGIMRVSADGGDPEVLVPLNASESAVGPQLIDRGRSLLFTVTIDSSPDRWDKANIVLQSLASGQRKVIVRGGTDARYVPTGHLLYVIGNTLFAVAFDESSGRIKGAPTPVLEGVRRTGAGTTPRGLAQFALSPTGTLLYIPGVPALTRAQNRLTLIDRGGTEYPLSLPPQSYLHPRISPNGKKLAFGTDDGKEAVVWILDDLNAGTRPRRLTFRGRNLYPVWRPDGRFITFQSDLEGDRGLFWQPEDGSAPAERLTKAEAGIAHVPNSWTPDGKMLAFHVGQPGFVGSGGSIWTMSPEGDRRPTPFAEPQGLAAYGGAFSPDGRWLAYAASSSAGGPPNLFLQPFPATGAKYQLSSTVGAGAAWSPDGRQIFYQTGPGADSNSLLTIDVQTSPSFSLRKPARIEFRQQLEQNPTYRSYDITPDGKQFVMVVTGRNEANVPNATEIKVVLNWQEELKQRVPTR